MSQKRTQIRLSEIIHSGFKISCYLIVFANAIKIRDNVSNIKSGVITDIEFERRRKIYWSIIIGILLGWVALIIISQFI